MGKTEALFNVLGHRLADGPRVPALFIAATEKLARSISKDRFMKMVLSTKSLNNLLAKGQKDNILEKFFAGVRLGFGFAGSTTELASHPAGLVLVDEVDRMQTDVGNEGDPVVLARARTKNYSGSKIGVSSTPTIEGASAIQKHWESGTMGKFAWPCPHCSEYFVPGLATLWWPEGCTPEQALFDARVTCPECGSQIENKHKEKMNENGRYIYHVWEQGDDGEMEIKKTGFEPTNNPNWSYWVNGLCSPWQSFGEVAAMMITAYRSKSQSTIQGAINTYCGELFKMQGDAPKPGEVDRLIEDYREGTVPHGVQMITAGVDVQKDGLFLSVWGWGANSESWKLYNTFIGGQTEYDNVWLLLWRHLERDYEGRRIDRCMIDSGFRPGDTEVVPDHMVYKFCRQHRGLCYPAKGRDVMDRSFKESAIDVTLSGKTIKNGLKLFHVNTHYFKTFVYGRIRWPEEMMNEPGRMHLDRDTTEEFCKQLVSEELLIKPSGRYFWRKIRANHYLDTAVYAACAAASLGVHNLQPLSDKPDKTEPTPKKTDQPYIKKHGPGYIRRP
jgi:phage terminase large subunit GpA-like protein